MRVLIVRWSPSRTRRSSIRPSAAMAAAATWPMGRSGRRSGLPSGLGAARGRLRGDRAPAAAAALRLLREAHAGRRCAGNSGGGVRAEPVRDGRRLGDAHVPRRGREVRLRQLRLSDDAASVEASVSVPARRWPAPMRSSPTRCASSRSCMPMKPGGAGRGCGAGHGWPALSRSPSTT